jgi:hypothetical protein
VHFFGPDIYAAQDIFGRTALIDQRVVYGGELG